MVELLADRIRAGETCLTVKLNLSDPQCCEIAGLAGADAVWLDREHCLGGWSELYHQVLAARRRGCEAIVRVPRGSYSDLVKPYELGASALMVPQVADLADAREVVAQTRFHPIGRRALDGGNSDGDFGQLGTDDYLASAARETLLVLQLESPGAVADAEAIAALPGVDVVFFGPGDFAQAIGAPGRLDHPDVAAAQRAVAAAARAADKHAGTVLHPGTSLSELRRQGYTLVNVAADVIELGAALRRRISAARREIPPAITQEGIAS